MRVLTTAINHAKCKILLRLAQLLRRVVIGIIFLLPNGGELGEIRGSVDGVDARSRRHRNVPT